MVQHGTKHIQNGKLDDDKIIWSKPTKELPVTRIAEKVHAGCATKMSEHTVYRNLAVYWAA